jgi:hypothetical protein
LNVVASYEVFVVSGEDGERVSFIAEEAFKIARLQRRKVAF